MTMTVTKIEPGSYTYMVAISNANKNLMSDVNEWIIETGIQCSLVPGRAFFKDEEDMLLFVLRWA